MEKSWYIFANFLFFLIRTLKNQLFITITSQKNILTAKKKKLKLYMKTSKCLYWINLVSWKIAIFLSLHFILVEICQWPTLALGLVIGTNDVSVCIAKFYFVAYSVATISAYFLNDSHLHYKISFPVCFFSSLLAHHKLIDSIYHFFFFYSTFISMMTTIDYLMVHAWCSGLYLCYL